MFNFGAFWRNGIKPHPGAAAVVGLVVVVFLSTPFLLVWRFAKRVPVVGGALQAAENANPLR